MITTDATGRPVATGQPAETRPVEIHSVASVGPGGSDGAVKRPLRAPGASRVDLPAGGGFNASAAELGGNNGQRSVTPPRPAATIRILITGSRDWTDKRAIADALRWTIGEYPALIVPDQRGSPSVLWDRITVVHGAARGADTLAGRIAAAWGMRVDPHPVTSEDWDTCASECKPGHRKTRPDGSTYCPSAGNRRNQRMVDLGADICLGFPAHTGWSGTRDCMTRAEKAGIRVVDWPAHQLAGGTQ